MEVSKKEVTDKEQEDGDAVEELDAKDILKAVYTFREDWEWST
ncbi:MAG TPA: hypothetical protein VIH03_07315 [Nitrososphaerales archaeon]